MGSKSKPSESSSKRHHSSTSSSSSSSRNQERRTSDADNWKEVNEPEERRRIQNRIAQRKFREKARENKERAERDARNREHAASSYQIASPQDMTASEHDHSGLPWGSINIRHVVARGHETESRRSSGRGEYIHEDVGHASYDPYGPRGSHDAGYGAHDPANYGGSSAAGDDFATYFEEESPQGYGYEYDQTGRVDPNLRHYGGHQR